MSASAGDEPTPSTSVAAGKQAPAGHVKGYEDTVLAIMEADTDHCKVRNEYFEGKALTPAEFEFRRRIFTTVSVNANEHLKPHGVQLVACMPEANGFGVRFLGIDDAPREYTIDYRYGDDIRLNPDRLDSTAFVKESITIVVEAVLKQRAEYLRRGGLSG